MSEFEFSDSIAVDAAPAALYAMVSDVTRMGEWSPVCRACWWDDAEGPHVGAWFTGRNESAGRVWETRSQVVVAEPGKEFAWEVNGGWVRWGYEFEADGDRTRLTESWHFLPAGIAGFHERFGPDAKTQITQRIEAARSGIPATLTAIKRAAEG